MVRVIDKKLITIEPARFEESNTPSDLQDAVGGHIVEMLFSDRVKLFLTPQVIDQLKSQREAVAKWVKSYLETLGNRLSAVELTPKDWEDKIGIGLFSVLVGAQDSNGQAILAPDEVRAPTVGLILPSEEHDEAVSTAFHMGANNREEITRLSRRIEMWNAGNPATGTTEKPDDFEEKFIVPAGSSVGLRARVTDTNQFSQSGLTRIEPERRDMTTSGGYYACRFVK